MRGAHLAKVNNSLARLLAVIYVVGGVIETELSRGHGGVVGLDSLISVTRFYPSAEQSLFRQSRRSYL